MSDGEYTPLIDREREPKARIHEELTESARERLVAITSGKAVRYRRDVMDYLMKKVGKSPLRKFYDEESVKHDKFIMKGETIHVLTYIEMLMKKFHKHNLLNEEYRTKNKIKIKNDPENVPPTSNTLQTIENIRDVLVTEGILWDMQPLGEGGVFHFTPLESEGMKEIDENLQEISEDQPWANALKGYNDAFDRYLSGDFDEHIPKKLYYSIEEVLKIICVDEEGWTDNRELTHAKYLDMLHEHGVYDAHGVTADELGDFLNSLERMVAKVGADRKHPHAYHDRAYATLLIHQVGAYLYFLINRYEAYKS